MYRTKNEMIYSELKKTIINGTLSPGEKLIISNISKQYGMSDIPVREALTRLEAEGLVFSKPHSGYHVSPMTEEEIIKIFEIRTVLESYCTRVAVPHIPESTLRELEEMVQNEEERFIELQDSEGYRNHNFQFHRKVYEHCGNDILLNLINQLWENTKRYPSQFGDIDHMRKSHEEHIGLVQAIKNRDSLLAEQLEQKHKQGAIQAIVKVVRKTVTSD